MSLLFSTSYTHNSLGNLLKKSCSHLSLLAAVGLVLSGCADATGPDSRTVNVPAPKAADARQKGVNENGESIIYLPLGDDVLMPQSSKADALPDTVVGPFELRGETLAGALQLIMDGIDIPVAFEAENSLTQTITVTNLKGPLSQVVNDVCSLANMYCSYKGGVLSVKEREIFTVTVPPIVAKTDIGTLLTNISAAVGSITGETPITDPSTRTIVYRASQRTAEMANRYFQRLRSNTAMIVYETYIWEVTLDSGNSTGIKWQLFEKIGRFKFGVNFAGATDTAMGTPVSIGLPTTSNVNFTSSDVLQFISTYGAVKTISQPQVSVLSGSDAKLRIADKQNYVASITKTASTTTGGADSFSTTTATADTGFTLNIGSNWDNSTVYGNISILLQEVRQIDTFEAGTDATVQLPQTTEREVTTSVRVRPGDMILIAGLVRESDKFSKDGLGLSKPFIPTSRSVTTGNTELVFLLRPRVVVFTAQKEDSPKKGEVALPEQSFTQPTAAPVEPVADLAPVAAQNEGDTNSAPKLLPMKENQKAAVSGDAQSSSIEIQSLSDVMADSGTAKTADSSATPTDAKKSERKDANPDVMEASKAKNANPSVIVNYDVLGH